MKLDFDVILNVVVAMVIFAIINKLVLRGVVEMVPTIYGSEGFQMDDFEMDSED